MNEERKTMTVPQMRKILGLKKTESYWLVHRNFFQTDIVNGHMMIDVESFEKWYANQVKHRKVDGPEPGAELTRMSYSFAEVAEMLGVSGAVVYEIWDKNNLETFTVDFVKRIPKEVFENGMPDRRAIGKGSTEAMWEQKGADTFQGMKLLIWQEWHRQQ